MTRSERWMAARWALAALVVGGLFMVGVVAGLRSLNRAYVADQRDRSALIRSEGSWTPPTNDPNIHYAPPVVVDLDHQGVRR